MPVGRHERDGHQTVGRQPDAEVDRAVDADPALRQLGERLAPDREDGVGGEDGVPQRARLLDVGLLGLVAAVGVAQVEVDGDAEQGVRRDRRAGPEGPVGDVGLIVPRSDRPWKTTVSASVSARPSTLSATASDASGSMRARRSRSSGSSSPIPPCRSSMDPS
jgi:hypothetical protein